MSTEGHRWRKDGGGRRLALSRSEDGCAEATAIRLRRAFPSVISLTAIQSEGSS